MWRELRPTPRQLRHSQESALCTSWSPGNRPAPAATLLRVPSSSLSVGLGINYLTPDERGEDRISSDNRLFVSSPILFFIQFGPKEPIDDGLKSLFLIRSLFIPWMLPTNWEEKSVTIFHYDKEHFFLFFTFWKINGYVSFQLAWQWREYFIYNHPAFNGQFDELIITYYLHH